MIGLPQITLVALLAGLFLPTLPFYFKIASSLALGVATFSILLLIFSMPFSKIRVSRTAFFCVLAAFIYVFCHLVFVRGLSSVAYTRAFYSFLPLALMVLAADVFGQMLWRLPPERLRTQISTVFYVCVGIGIIGLLFAALDLRLGDWRAPLFPFTEPSVYVLFISPFVLFVAASRLRRGVLIFLFLALAVLFFRGSAVMAVLLILASSLYPKRLTMAVIPLLLGGVILASSAVWGYYLDRAQFWNSDNLSALVYRQGLEIARESLVGENLTGVGFQQLGLTEIEVQATDIIRDLREGADMNERDGGFVAAKLLGELGLFGLPLTLFLIYNFGRSFLQLRAHASRARPLDSHLVFLNCCILAFSIDFLFRGVGYFTLNSVLIIMSMLLLYRVRKVYRRGGRARFGSSRYGGIQAPGSMVSPERMRLR